MKCLFLTLTMLLLVAAPTVAQETFSFQGKLTNPEGKPVADGTHAVRFQLFAQVMAGSPLWEEAHTVTTRDGVFSVVLGTKTAFNLEAFGETPYLALTVEGQTLVPRVSLTAVPYAMKSYRLDEEALVAGSNVTITRRSDGVLRIGATGGAGGLTSVARDGTLRGNGTSGSPLGLADGSVTGQKLANGVLVAGSNVTITRQTSGAFEVAATGGGGGLAQVTSNATLTGEGTAGSPLAVQVPLVLTNPGNGTVLEAHNGNGTLGMLGGSESGAYGESGQGNRGLLGGEFSGVFGLHSSGNTGELGSGSYGAYGFSSGLAGVYGGHNNGTFGTLGGSYGVYGEHPGGIFGILGGNGAAVYGENGNTRGFLGLGNYGAYGQETSSGNTGILGGFSYGVWGISSSGHAGYFEGDVHVTGTLSKGGGSFKIDHPLDPANKYLSHSFVESPDMMNVYNGNVTTDENGEAVVTLPDYFEALNHDFRYQLTAIGAPGPNLYIAEKISGNRFKIAGGTSRMEVSWQVTGIRGDAWAEENRIVVEQDKPADEQGRYLYPKLYGQPERQGIGWIEESAPLMGQKAMRQQIDKEHQRNVQEQRLPLPDNRP